MAERMRVAVLGITGMLGHALFDRLSVDGRFEVHGTTRGGEDLGCWFGESGTGRIVRHVEAGEDGALVAMLDSVKPQAVVNGIGIVKQDPLGSDPVASIAINSLFPHRLAALCRVRGVRLLHVSTDCVFQGTKGSYSERDLPDATDLYGRSKLLGEVVGEGCLTLRTSIIGHELWTRHGLVEWFLHASGSVEGYDRAIFSGLTCLELSSLIGRVLASWPGLTGLYHVAGEPITKYELLRSIARHYGKEIDIRGSGRVQIDRSLDASAFRQTTGYAPPGWEEMIAAMRRHYDAFAYESKRNHSAGGCP